MSCKKCDKETWLGRAQYIYEEKLKKQNLMNLL